MADLIVVEGQNALKYDKNEKATAEGKRETNPFVLI